MLYDNKHMANTKTLTPYLIATAILIVLGLFLIGYGQHRKQSKVIVFGLILMVVALVVILIGHHEDEAWAPPIDGHQFMGLADPGQMASANYAQLLASETKNCEECAHTANICMRDPFVKSCYDAKQKCNKSACNPNVKQIVMRDSTIYGSPSYSNSGTPPAHCS